MGGRIGIWELMVILFIVLLIFGGKRIPEIAKSLGSGIKEFKKGMKEDDSKSLMEHKDTGESKGNSKES